VVYLSGVLEGPPKVTAVDEKTGNTLWVTDRKDTTLDVIPGSKGSLFFRGWEKIYAVDPKTGEDKWVYKSKDLISGVIFGSEDTMIFDEQGTIKALYVSEEAKLLAQEKKGGTDSAPASEISVEDEYIDIGGVRLPVHHASAS
jgi:outer membrane protein assembly factor BamB